MYAKRIAAVVAAVSVAAALAVGVTPQPVQAAASVSIAGVAKTNAVDIKSKGIIRTPVVETPGNSAVVSRSYVITKGKKVVARTSSQSKAYKLGVGTYKVKSTVKYRNFTESDQYRRVTERQIVGYKERQVAHQGDPITAEWDETREFALQNMKSCKVTTDDLTDGNSPTSEYYWVLQISCTDKDGAVYSGPVEFFKGSRTEQEMKVEYPKNKVFTPIPVYGTAMQFNEFTGVSGYGVVYIYTGTLHHETVYDTWYETVYDEVWGNVSWDEWIGTKKIYGATKTATKTQTVKIGNSGTMTFYEYKKVKNKAKLSTVKKIVGGSGKVVDRYSYGKHEYVTREFNGHYVYFDNGKVYGKYW